MSMCDIQNHLFLNSPKDSSIRSENRRAFHTISRELFEPGHSEFSRGGKWKSLAANENGGGHPIPDLFCPTIRVPLRAARAGCGGGI